LSGFSALTPSSASHPGDTARKPRSCPDQGAEGSEERSASMGPRSGDPQRKKSASAWFGRAPGQIVQPTALVRERYLPLMDSGDRTASSVACGVCTTIPSRETRSQAASSRRRLHAPTRGQSPQNLPLAHRGAVRAAHGLGQEPPLASRRCHPERGHPQWEGRGTKRVGHRSADLLYSPWVLSIADAFLIPTTVVRIGRTSSVRSRAFFLVLASTTMSNRSTFSLVESVRPKGSSLPGSKPGRLRRFGPPGHGTAR
jgi:hypothetical protein